MRGVQTTPGATALTRTLWRPTSLASERTIPTSAAFVAVVLDGSPLYETGLYPRIFESRDLLALDVYLLLMLLAGAGFGAAALVLARRSRFPRTEAYGAGLTSPILLARFFLDPRPVDAAALYDERGVYARGFGVSIEGAVAWSAGALVYYLVGAAGGTLPALATALFVYAGTARLTSRAARAGS